MDEGILLDHPAVYKGDVGKRVIIRKRRLDPGTQTYDLLVNLPTSDGDDTWWVTEEAVQKESK